MNDEKKQVTEKAAPLSEPPNDGNVVESDLPFEKMPKGMKELMAFSSGPVFPPYMHKIDGNHITKIIESIDKSEQNMLEDRRSTRRYGFAGLILAILLFVFITYAVMPHDVGLYREIAIAVGSALLGFGGGWGYANKRKQDSG